MPDGRLYVLIRGIDMAYDARVLLGLFHDRDKIIVMDEDSVSSFDAGSMLITLERKDLGGGFSAEAAFYDAINGPDDLSAVLDGCRKPDLQATMKISWEEMERPGGRLLRNGKIICGTVLYRVLQRAFQKDLPYGSLTGVRPVKLAAICLEDGMDEEQTVELLREVTGISREKAQLLFEVACQERSYMDGDASAVNLYIGIPFCASRCLYCSFTSYPIDRLAYLVEPYLDALDKEMAFGARWIRENHLKINSLYIGGGTPTALPEKDFARLLAIVQGFFGHAREFTVEAGRPDTINMEKLRIIKDSGATRISINPQSMNDETLRLIGRNHTPEDITEKFRMARDMGFDNINMDIIAGLPGENLDMFRQTLSRIEELRPDSLTVHTMAIKRASRLHQTVDEYASAPDEVVDQMIEEARKSARRMGMKPYYLYRQKNMLANLENTGYAVPGKGCRYNVETMVERQSILAFGAGAITKIVIPSENRIERTDNVKEVTQYIERIEEMIERKKKLFSETIK
ncbi:MAG TPA: coproporphyrinogen dehydrogenase HemZ [Thermoclostridium caenicola]|uniref:Oxygen-independent coproporphyrinogen-3 oxidase n=1 Tax=Thermoclostridium caenicola TaxID=659425 RepID=A0A1M6GVF3_9FIRM|nr:coproporphyrinogen dehydrogenase HemZ [Thermoclostridium caenicola]SHJ13953.1 oxygen-independent coproporphyrinogen-3 oxidase [Thermoclostridium caenicola]HOK43524.1 coproporphyrinogen dehydrogenase HemZ [Thermoclostridium caenicola]HOL85199.1 coproporphyrinogen dehydrogenase HemZ [Thermoclostridium caenicola]HPO77541.1 coproporphyrinogen dehydrogenase HemZ [Thermoclostridium caenicola]